MTSPVTPERAVGPSLSRLAGLAALLGCGYLLCAVASIALVREGGVAAVWPADALVIAALFLSRVRAWPVFILVAAAACLAANLMAGDGWHVSATLAVVHCLASLLAAALLRRRYEPNELGDGNAFYWWLFVTTALVAPLTGATAAALLLGGGFQGGVAELWLAWFGAESLGNQVMLPFLLSAAAAARARALTTVPWRRIAEGAAILLLVATTATIIFFASSVPLLFLAFPATVVAALRLGPLGASTAVIVVGLIGAWPSAVGDGPIGLFQLGETARLLVLQLFLVCLKLTTVPITAALARAGDVATQLAESEARYGEILQGVSDVIFRTDSAGRWTYLNAAWPRMTGFPIAKCLGRPFLDFIHAEDRERAFAIFQPLASGRQVECRFEVRYLCTDGEDRWAEVSARVIRGAAGRLAGAYGTIVDITDRKSSESQRRTEEARYRAIFDTAVDAIVVIDIQGSIHSFNPAAERIFGYDAAEVTGHDVGILMAPAEASAHGAHLHRYASGGSARIIGIGRELVGRRKDGTLFPLELSIAEWEREGMRFFTGHMRDISVRRLAEEELRAATEQTEANNRLLTMAEALAHVGHWRIDLGSRKLLWSDEVYRIHGREIGLELDLSHASDAYHPDDRERVTESFAALVREGGELSFTARIERDDGEFRFVAVDGQAERDDAGAITSLFGIIQDISARVHAEEALRDSERRYRLLAENATDVIVQLDLDDRCTYASRSMQEVTGFTAEEAVGVDLLAITHPSDRDRLRDQNDRLKRGEVDRIVVEYRTRRRTGEWIWLEARSRLVRGADGLPEGVVSVVRNISERKALEAELIAAKEQAEAGGRAKADFLATMSHELRTPMTGVLGMLELMRLDSTPEEQRSYLDTLESSAKTMMQVVDDILDFSKIEAGKLALEQVDFDVERLARETVDLFRTPASTRGVVLNLHVDKAGSHGVVRGDPTRIRQVLSNLVGNALKFTDRGTVDVDIRCSDVPPARWTFAVRDTGIGIAPEVLPHLFQAFSQADSSTTRRFGGTGLGLAICRRLVTAMNGDIRVSSEPGRGSVFEFELLLPAGDPARLGGVDKATAYAAPSRVLDILVAEDNLVNQLLVTSMLRKMGHQVTCVGNGRLAVEAVQAANFDLVFMDMQMPVMDGSTATAAIRALGGRWKVVPIFALTADALMQGREVYAELGLDGFVAKPIDSAAIRRVLDRVAGDGPSAGKPGVPAGGNDVTAFFDLERLAVLRDEFGADLVADLLRLLAEDVRSKMASLPSSLDDIDRAEIARIAHAVKGAAGNIAAIRLASVAGDMEKLGAGSLSIARLDEFRAVAEGTLAAAEQLGAEAA